MLGTTCPGSVPHVFDRRHAQYRWRIRNGSRQDLASVILRIGRYSETKIEYCRLRRTIKGDPVGAHNLFFAQQSDTNKFGPYRSGIGCRPVSGRIIFFIALICPLIGIVMESLK